MANFRHVGQEPNSGDCGFFCGYVLHLNLVHHGVAANMEMTRDLVYQARHGYRPSLPDQGPSPLTAHLGIWDVPLYLASLGVLGYATVPVPGAPAPLTTQTAYTEILSALNHRGAHPNAGVIIPLGTTSGHYIAVLRGNAQAWAIYDPAGTQGPGGVTIYADAVAAQGAAQLIARSFVNHLVRLS